VTVLYVTVCWPFFSRHRLNAANSFSLNDARQCLNTQWLFAHLWQLITSAGNSAFFAMPLDLVRSQNVVMNVGTMNVGVQSSHIIALKRWRHSANYIHPLTCPFRRNAWPYMAWHTQSTPLQGDDPEEIEMKGYSKERSKEWEGWEEVDGSSKCAKGGMGNAIINALA